MTQIELGWGSGPSETYEGLAARFRPIFQRIGEGAVARELDRTLPHEPIQWLKDARFGAVRVPREHGGDGASLPELFNLLIELSAADSNVTQALRAHFGFAEDVVNARSAERRQRWFPRLAGGEIAGNAWSEIGDAKQAAFSTKVTRNGHGLVVNGAKFYTTGSLFADWIDIGASGEDGASLTAVVSRRAPGVEVVDDWDGFGQILTASGTSTFTDVPVEEGDVIADEDRFKYSAAFYQLVHLATLAGIGRAASNDVAKAVAERRRTYTHAAGPRSSQDAQVLQIVGRVRGAAYGAGAIVLKTAQALQRAFDARFAGDAAVEEAANAIAELETAQAQTVVSNLILDAVTLLFDALGASATRRSTSFDRHWRNARTLASHNPRIYKDRIVGDFAVNGTPPPYQWRIGQP
ncbi:acyl-CoA dehydrogenase family protein [Labrys wisconsinensis]|uniref:Alkylation response protein AidB-like acyl-CoA dehydrogenase n=1 Tax=Labrys wisconsinensis TaxID=425677 RepID=A0ABU0J6I5_9HYPH|nr:acyl-CoA dehydrogenase family protein [Labrys wisconsinensis]MDQ0468812.1 alkylation response protein AidB-like acyl-CoA dehydrogenase [Labrys wisconsinensis]